MKWKLQGMSCEVEVAGGMSCEVEVAGDVT